MTRPCGYAGCTAPAVYAGRTTVPDAPVWRCAGHGGHHDFTHRLRGGEWVKWVPVHARKGEGMSDSDRSSEEISRELAAAEARYAALEKMVEESEQRIDAAKKEMYRFQNYSGGKLSDLHSELARAQRLEAFRTGRAVRVSTQWPSDLNVCAFDKLTPKRIYLRSRYGTLKFWNRDGTSQWDGNIHPDDLALILAGRTEELPLVGDWQRKELVRA